MLYSLGKKNAFIVLFILLINTALLAQQKNFCSYVSFSGITATGASITETDVSLIVKSIMQLQALPQNFSMQPTATVDNAAAVIDIVNGTSKRVIRYNPQFMGSVNNTCKTNFAATVIFAHEIAHHFAGHTLNNGTSNPDIEIEADIFAGNIAKRMGATLLQAQSPILAYANTKTDATHPPQSARLIAIKNGYDAASFNAAVPQAKATNTNNNYNIATIVKNGLALRNRVLTNTEIGYLNNGDARAANLNAETLITRLPPGTPVEFLYNKGNFYQIKTTINGQIQTGYIVKQYFGKSTLEGKRINQQQTIYAKSLRAIRPYKIAIFICAIILGIIVLFFFGKKFLKNKK